VDCFGDGLEDISLDVVAVAQRDAIRQFPPVGGQVTPDLRGTFLE